MANKEVEQNEGILVNGATALLLLPLSPQADTARHTAHITDRIVAAAVKQTATESLETGYRLSPRGDAARLLGVGAAMEDPVVPESGEAEDRFASRKNFGSARDDGGRA